MYRNFNTPIYSNYYPYKNNMNINNNDRFIGGGFLGPFILGGITGGLLAPAFNGYGRPCCNNYPIYYAPYPPYYGPYYR